MRQRAAPTEAPVAEGAPAARWAVVARAPAARVRAAPAPVARAPVAPVRVARERADHPPVARVRAGRVRAGREPAVRLPTTADRISAGHGPASLSNPVGRAYSTA